MKYDKIDRKIIHLLQGDLLLTPRPYQDISENLGVSEDDIIRRIERLKASGALRRMGAILRHQKAGYTANAMVLWRVESSDIDYIGELMASFLEISHCYQREFLDYSLFTMIHARTNEELIQLVQQLAVLSGIQTYKIVKSTHELKKVSMAYVL
ncbi:MAG: AsnC family transcriptional regulator [Bacillota bacterium]|nr:AsnC family transcriptional regulator [Bacillota bacterium]